MFNISTPETRKNAQKAYNQQARREEEVMAGTERMLKAADDRLNRAEQTAIELRSPNMGTLFFFDWGWFFDRSLLHGRCLGAIRGLIDVLKQRPVPWRTNRMP